MPVFYGNSARLSLLSSFSSVEVRSQRTAEMCKYKFTTSPIPSRYLCVCCTTLEEPITSLCLLRIEVVCL
ncbi:hypothetical protein NECAME_16152, partial [Necator americanus]